MRKTTTTLATAAGALALAGAVLSGAAVATASRDSILAELKSQAAQENPGFAGFSPERGAAFFKATQKGGKPDTPSCTTCHGETPFATGKTRAGKPIDPMAVSANPARYTDPREVEKWFGRNCMSVLGRECTAAEKGDFISFMASQ